MLVAGSLRPSEPGADAALLHELASDPLAVAVRPRPLSAEAVADIVRDRLGAEADPAFGAACLADRRTRPCQGRRRQRHRLLRGRWPSRRARRRGTLPLRRQRRVPHPGSAAIEHLRDGDELLRDAAAPWQPARLRAEAMKYHGQAAESAALARKAAAGWSGARRASRAPLEPLERTAVYACRRATTRGGLRLESGRVLAVPRSGVAGNLLAGTACSTGPTAAARSPERSHALAALEGGDRAAGGGLGDSGATRSSRGPTPRRRSRPPRPGSPMPAGEARCRDSTSQPPGAPCAGVASWPRPTATCARRCTSSPSAGLRELSGQPARATGRSSARKGLEELEEAVTILDGTPARLELACSLAALGGGAPAAARPRGPSLRCAAGRPRSPGSAPPCRRRARRPRRAPRPTRTRRPARAAGRSGPPSAGSTPGRWASTIAGALFTSTSPASKASGTSGRPTPRIRALSGSLRHSSRAYSRSRSFSSARSTLVGGTAGTAPMARR